MKFNHFKKSKTSSLLFLSSYFVWRLVWFSRFVYTTLVVSLDEKYFSFLGQQKHSQIIPPHLFALSFIYYFSSLETLWDYFSTFACFFLYSNQFLHFISFLSHLFVFFSMETVGEIVEIAAVHLLWRFLQSSLVFLPSIDETWAKKKMLEIFLVLLRTLQIVMFTTLILEIFLLFPLHNLSCPRLFCYIFSLLLHLVLFRHVSFSVNSSTCFSSVDLDKQDTKKKKHE